MAKVKKFGSKRTKRYDEGGDVEEMKKGIASGFKSEAPEGPSTSLSRETRGDAFKRSRARGEKTFEFEGKKYTTDVKGAAPKAPAKAEPKAEIKVKPAISNAGLPKSAEDRAAPKTKRDFSDMSKISDLAYNPEFIPGPGGAARGVARGLSNLAVRGGRELAKKFTRAEPELNDITPKQIGNAPKQLEAPSRQLPAPTPKPGASKQLGAPKKKAEAERAAPRDDDESRFADEGNPNFKRGGKVKKMAGGGSASKRADGCAQRGKTRA